jgi:hypothetical protein
MAVARRVFFIDASEKWIGAMPERNGPNANSVTSLQGQGQHWFESAKSLMANAKLIAKERLRETPAQRGGRWMSHRCDT